MTKTPKTTPAKTQKSPPKRAAADKIDRAVNETGAAIKGSVDDLKSGVAEIAGSARDTAEATAEAIADNTSRASNTLRDAASALRDGSFQERSFGQLAASLADASDAIRDKDLGQISRDVSDLARRNPLLFAGGAALIGFAVARMISKPDTRHDT